MDNEEPLPARLPVIFIGHGNPMNALADNSFTRRLAGLGAAIARPKAVLCISAHWMTEGTWVTHMPMPKTIHDFYGFPQELFNVRYPAPGSPALAEMVRSRVKNARINLDDEMWGIDHGAWSVIRHMYPKADVPVLQLSVYMEQPPEYHFRLGEELRALRNEGILIVGSGNIVHNLRRMNRDEQAKPHDWATEFDEWVKGRLEERDCESLINDATLFEAGKLSIPAPDHWYPLLYALGAADDKDTLRFEYEGIDHASISMRTFSLGLA